MRPWKIFQYVHAWVETGRAWVYGFKRCESGATTTDWVVGSAAAVSMAVGVMTETSTSTVGLADNTASFIASQDVSLSNSRTVRTNEGSNYYPPQDNNNSYPVSGGSTGGSSQGSTADASGQTEGTTADDTSAGDGDQATAEAADNGEGETQTADAGDTTEATQDDAAPSDDDEQTAANGDTTPQPGGGTSAGDSTADAGDLPLDPDCYRNNGTIKKQCL